MEYPVSLPANKARLDFVNHYYGKKKTVFLIAEYNNIIIGTVGIDLNIWRQNHVGDLGITIKKDYRRIGLGDYLMNEGIKLAKIKLEPKPKIIRLSVFSTNKPAISLYRKFGLEKIAKIPRQIQYNGKLVDEIIMLLYL